MPGRLPVARTANRVAGSSRDLAGDEQERPRAKTVPSVGAASRDPASRVGLPPDSLAVTTLTPPEPTGTPAKMYIPKIYI